MGAWICSDKHIASLVKWGWPDVGEELQQEIADRLAELNVASVNYRYNGETKAEPVDMSEAEELMPWDAESLARSYDYQTCELPDWEGTHEYLHVLQLIKLAEAACPKFGKPEGKWSI